MDPPAGVDPGPIGSLGVVAGRYRLDRSLGASRMAEVFVATDLRLRRPVAVKRLPSAALRDATAEARFAREARALARVNDPNVVTVFDLVVDDGRPFLVMELVDGTTLRQVLDRDERLDPARIVAIAGGICSGLEAVHARGIVHRDLKPSNVFMTTAGTVKIGDFGIARVADDVTVTRTGEVFGSAPYVAPEQVIGNPVDARTDLYALGCVLFEMATGRPPFHDRDPATLAYRHVHEAPERADAVAPRVPADLASMIDRLLAKDPADRPPTADAVHGAIAAMSVAGGSVDAGDAPTQPVAPPVTTDVLPAMPPMPPGPPQRGSSSLLPWVAALVLGIVVLLVLNAFAGGSEPDARASSPSSRPAAASPSPRSPTPTPTEAPVAQDPTDALLALIDDLGASGAVGEHLLKDLDHGMDEVLHALDEGDGEKLVEALDHLRDKVEKGVDHGEISAQDAAQLDQAIGALAATVDQDQEGDEGD